MIDKLNKSKYVPWQLKLYLVPPILIYSFFIVIPLISAFRNTLFDWSGITNMKFVGLENYRELINDKQFWDCFVNNILITLCCIIGQIGIAFVFSSFLYSRYVIFKNVHRVLIYFPVILSGVVIGFIWSFIFNYNYGLLNSVLRMVGLDSLVQVWLENPKTIIFIVSIPLIWQYIGYYMVILLAGYSSIDKEILNMAEIEGASGFKKTIYITLPLLKNVITVALMLCISGNMKIFDHIYVMTAGGPGTSSMVMALYAYNNAFIKYRMGYANTISIGILVLIMILVVSVRALTRTNKDDE